MRRWTPLSAFERALFKRLWPIGIAGTGAGIYLDQTSTWWTAHPYTVNIASGLTISLLGLPVVVAITRRLMLIAEVESGREASAREAAAAEAAAAAELAVHIKGELKHLWSDLGAPPTTDPFSLLANHAKWILSANWNLEAADRPLRRTLSDEIRKNAGVHLYAQFRDEYFEARRRCEKLLGENGGTDRLEALRSFAQQADYSWVEIELFGQALRHHGSMSRYTVSALERLGQSIR